MMILNVFFPFLLAIDTDSGQLYCAFCADYKYDSDFVKIDLEQNFIASSQRSMFNYVFFKLNLILLEVYIKMLSRTTEGDNSEEIAVPVFYFPPVLLSPFPSCDFPKLYYFSTLNFMR